jgi:hypothetical protein
VQSLFYRVWQGSEAGNPGLTALAWRMGFDVPGGGGQ